MWWNEDDDILDIIGGAKERLLDADAPGAIADDEDDDTLLKAAEYFRVYEQALQGRRRHRFRRHGAAVASRPWSATRPTRRRHRRLRPPAGRRIPGRQSRPDPLIDHFVDAGVQLWAVGDDDQTLYAFRASDVRYILEFAQKYPSAAGACARPQLPLVARDRGGGQARDPQQPPAASDKDYKPTVTEPGEIVIRGYSTPEIEARQVAAAIASLLENGYAPSNWRCSTARERWACRSRPP